MVHDQGPCGAGWAFASKGALEAAAELQQGISNAYSAQQLVDCAVQHGCSDGDPESAFSYYKQAGVEPDMTYPYNAEEGQCNYDQSQVDPQIRILASSDLEAHDAHYIKTVIAL